VQKKLYKEFKNENKQSQTLTTKKDVTFDLFICMLHS